MELRFVNQTIKKRILQMLREDSRRNLSSIAQALSLDVRIVVGYLDVIRKDYRFTVVRRPPKELSKLTPYLQKSTEVGTWGSADT